MSQNVDLVGDTLLVDGLVVGGTALTDTAAELNVLHGVTAGTVTASKAVVVDANKALTSMGGLTFAAGTTTVAPVNLTAGTNLTTAAAGAVEFDGTAFYATAVASARQQVIAEQYVFASADSSVYSNGGLDATTTPTPVFTTATSGTANGAVTLAAGKTYAFEGVYLLTNTGTTSHTWATLFGGAASLTGISYNVVGISNTSSAPATGGLTGYAVAATATTVTAASTSATENVVIRLKGIVTVNAGGTFIPQLQASARPGATGTPGVTVKAGSFFRICEMGSATAVGNWS